MEQKELFFFKRKAFWRLLYEQLPKNSWIVVYDKQIRSMPIMDGLDLIGHLKNSFLAK